MLWYGVNIYVLRLSCIMALAHVNVLAHVVVFYVSPCCGVSPCYRLTCVMVLALVRDKSLQHNFSDRSDPPALFPKIQQECGSSELLFFTIN